MSGATVALAFIVGAVFGSFGNVLIHRLPIGASIVSPPSHCPSCRTPIAPWDNVPIVSFLALNGRCRHCGAPIPVRYLIVEALTAVLFAGVVWRFGLTLEALRFAVLAFLLVVVGFADLERGLIPNAVTYPGIVLGLALNAAAGAWLPALVAAVGAAIVFLAIAVVSRGGMGGGDVKLAAMIGAFLGMPGTVVALFLAVALGALAGIILIALRLRTRKQTIPFGPALAGGALIAAFASSQLLRWYVNLSTRV
jgi:leader peptidase (prepilin peptidase)/N-methyltransferase